MTPETRYARSGDLRIADPAPAHFFSRLAGFSRLILFEKRGTGLSDRVAGIAHLEERMDDVRAIMDAAGSDRAALIGVSEGGPMILMFAATYPERVHALALYGSYARHPTLSVENIEQQVELIHQLWGTGEYMARFFAPSMLSNKEALRSFARRERLSASPSAAVAMVHMASEIDVRHILPAVRVPALILHRVADTRITADAGRYLAANIPNAKYVELPGSDHMVWQDRYIADRVVEEVEEFLTGSRSEPETDRVLATVLFTDIVDSTKRAAELGDREWRTLLDQHDQTVRQQFARFRGREVKNLGDGFMATFDGPARAVRCAAAIPNSVRPLGIAVRSGLHSGEIELKRDDVAGIAVHIAARVAAEAKAGETVVSSTVRDLVAGSGLRFQDRGVHALKGLPEDVHLYSVVDAR